MPHTVAFFGWGLRLLGGRKLARTHSNFFWCNFLCLPKPYHHDPPNPFLAASPTRWATLSQPPSGPPATPPGPSSHFAGFPPALPSAGNNAHYAAAGPPLKQPHKPCLPKPTPSAIFLRGTPRPKMDPYQWSPMGCCIRDIRLGCVSEFGVGAWWQPMLCGLGFSSYKTLILRPSSWNICQLAPARQSFGLTSWGFLLDRLNALPCIYC